MNLPECEADVVELEVWGTADGARAAEKAMVGRKEGCSELVGIYPV